MKRLNCAAEDHVQYDKAHRVGTFVGAGHVPHVCHPNDYVETVLGYTAKAAASEA